MTIAITYGNFCCRSVPPSHGTVDLPTGKSLFRSFRFLNARGFGSAHSHPANWISLQACVS